MISPLLLMIEEAIRTASANMAEYAERAAQAEAKASQPINVEKMNQAELAELTRQVLRLVEKRFIDRF